MIPKFSKSPEPEVKTCRYCKWLHIETRPIQGDTIGIKEYECHKNAPVLVSREKGEYTAWPIVTSESWCGDFELSDQ